MSKKAKPNKSYVLLVVLIVLVAVGVAAVMLWPVLSENQPKQPVQTGTTGTGSPAESQGLAEPSVNQTYYNLGYGLEITDSGKYAGLYMEDGSDEIVSDVMMLVVQNSGGDDIQLAQITALCGAEEYHFTLTNLAAGQRAVLLEQERKPAAELASAVLDTCVPFGTPMSLHEDVLQVSGLDGMLNVMNISDADIEGDIYVYYKYTARDVFYGGITFRVRIEGGLKAGEIRQIPAGHYDKDSCAVIQVTIYE